MEDFIRTLADGGNSRSHMDLGALHLLRVPPDLDQARIEYQKAADAGIAEAFLALYFFEQQLSEDRNVLTGKGRDLLHHAVSHGIADASSEVGRLLLLNEDPDQRERGKHFLEQSVKQGSAQGMYLLGLELLKGGSPFERNIARAKNHFEVSRNRAHLGALLQLALLSYQKVINTDWSCDQCLRLLRQYTELSFLFSDARVAFAAVVERDIRYALRLYQRLADMGSEGAAWNAEQLCRELKIDPSAWLRLQVKMRSDAALNRLGETQLAKGKVGFGLDTLRKAAESDGGAAFRLGWSIRDQGAADARAYFRRAIRLNPKAWMPAALARLWMFIERLPRAGAECARGKMGENGQYIAAELAEARRQMAAVGILLLLYWLIALRLRLMKRVRPEI
jgi:TPR repeat protein